MLAPKLRPLLVLVAAAVLALALMPAAQTEFDVLITGGRLLDGAGNPWVSGTVGIKGDRITRIGRFTASAARAIDATGLYVSPGFVDIMDQSGASLRRDGTAQSKVRQGVTTAIGGEGGTPGPPAELDQYFAAIERQGISPNFGTFVSAEQARSAVLGAVNREPDAAELERMKAVIEAAMQRGALGMTSALIYEPGSFAKTPELIALAQVAARYGGIYATHVRDEGLRVLEGIAEAIEIGEKAAIPVEIFHLKVAHRKLWKTAMPKIDELVRAARGRGVDVTADQYPYPFSGTGLETCIPDWVAEGGAAERNKRLQDPALRDRIRGEIARLDRVQAIGDWKNVVITSVPSGVEADYVGMTVADIARERKQAPEDAVMALVSSTGGRVSALFFLMDEADVRTAMTYPWVSVGSDAQAYDAATAQGRPHPRGYGTFPRIIARYVREAKVLTLENAVRRMTSLPAGKLHLAGRGVLAEGAFADLVLFDYDRIEDTATYQQPHQYPKGIPYVIVNGVVVVDGGQHTGARPGKVLRGSGRHVAN
jgi:N-acyl-D-aspartate/D-glutamate deacylase